MASLNELIQQGRDLGYGGDELKTFLKDQQALLRDERYALRQEEKEQREYQLAKETVLVDKEKAEYELRLAEDKARHEKEKVEYELKVAEEKVRLEKEKSENDLRVAEEKAKLERDKAEYEIRLAEEKVRLEKEKDLHELRMSELHHAQQIELLDREAESSGKYSSLTSLNKHASVKDPKIPPFDEQRDEIDSYLKRFELYATAQNWHRETWATNLSALLKGEALDVYALMPVEQALDYECLKTSLLKRYDLTEEGFKRKFRVSKPEVGETFSQFAVRLNSYFQRWIQMAKISNTYEDLADLMVRDQFLHICNVDLKMYLLERTPDNKNDMAEIADRYREARNVSAFSMLLKSDKGYRQGSQDRRNIQPGKVDLPKPNQGKTQNTKRCYNCNRFGHIASDCPPQGRGRVGAAIESPDRSRKRYNTPPPNNRRVRFDKSAEHMRGNDYRNPKQDKYDNPSSCGACSSFTNSIRTAVASSSFTEVTVTSSSKTGHMPVTQGKLEDQFITVLRDTGCSGVVAKRSLVPEDCFTGKHHSIILADGSKIDAPLANINIDTPYLVGKVEAWCLEAPIYDLMIGNVTDARDPDKPDPHWSTVNAVETRQQVRDKGKPYPQLKVPDIVKDEINPDDIRRAQQDDKTLANIRRLVQSDDKLSDTGKAKFCLKKNGLIYREFKSSSVDNGNVYVQVVVPTKYRTIVMKLAHESIMGGHLATRKTVLIVLSEFYWPGVQSDTKRFCESCDGCQRSRHKGKTIKVPLEKLPLIEERVNEEVIESIRVVNYTTSQGYEYNCTLVGMLPVLVMMCWLVTATAIVSRFLRIVLECLIYVYSFSYEITLIKVYLNRPVDDLRKFGSRLRSVKLKAKQRKGVIVFSKIDCLEHSVDNARLGPLQEKVECRNKAKFKHEEGNTFQVSYASRKLKKNEINYATIEKECLAIVWAVQKFYRYIYGREFVLETDHQPLVYLTKAKVANARLMRWALSLQPFRIRIEAIKGSANVGADYLSRI